MPSYIRCKATFPHSTGLPELAVVNTWSFITVDPATRAGAATDWTTNLNTFYSGIKSILSSTIAWNSGTYEYVDMGDAKPRVPYQTDAAVLGTLSTTNSDAPPEVALCLSFRGATGSGLNAKRRRGRVYIGPLQLPGTDVWSPANATVDLVANSAASLMTATYHKWAVYSPSTHHGVPVGGRLEDYPDEIPSQLDDAFTEVVARWVDNAFDTQRRRGVPATYRKSL